MSRAWTMMGVAIVAGLAMATNAWAQYPYSLQYDYYPRAVYTPMSYKLYGWSGWGLPPMIQADVAQGMGNYAQAASARNQAQGQAQARTNAQLQQAKAKLQQAKAEQDRGEMTRRWNLFFWSAQHALNLYRAGGKLPQDKREAGKLEAELARLRDHPEPAEIDRGAALNALLDQVTDPRLPASATKGARTPIDPNLIRGIPYDYASEVPAILLERITSDDRWPKPLLMPALAQPRQALRAAIDAAVEEDRRGPLSESSVRAVHEALKQLARAVMAAVPPKSQLASSAEGYLKELTGVARLLGRPDIGPVLGALNDQTGATVEDLLAFMQMFNLRFGEATTPEQKQVYQTLYPILAKWRKEVVRRAGKRLPQGGVTIDGLKRTVAPALMIFATMSWEQLLGHPPEKGPDQS